MTSEGAPIADLKTRLDAVAAEGERLEAEGLPFPTAQIRTAFEESVREGDASQAVTIVKRGEALLARVRPDWTWVRELLRRADELRAIAQTIGVDVAHLDTRVGNPRRRLMSDPLSSGSLQKAAASASLSLAVLNDAIPKFCVQEAQQLAVSIRKARDRGEDVRESGRSFSRLLQAIQDQNLPTAAARLVEVRKSVGRIPRAPALPAISPNEEDEILIEARNLARRLQRIKGKASNAQSAARLMAQVRAAISEDRRYGTPEEEIEALWAEVDRLTREKKRASEAPPVEAEEVSEGEEPPGTAPEEPVAQKTPVTPEATPAQPEGESEDRSERPNYPVSLYVPYIPPDLSQGEDEDGEAGLIPWGRGRKRPKPRT
ncbi:MAG: hypothetical protein ABSB97_01965 [Thermoplasmata archaeon]|jgi:hypothetical protein